MLLHLHAFASIKITLDRLYPPKTSFQENYAFIILKCRSARSRASCFPSQSAHVFLVSVWAQNNFRFQSQIILYMETRETQESSGFLVSLDNFIYCWYNSSNVVAHHLCFFWIKVSNSIVTFLHSISNVMTLQRC